MILSTYGIEKKDDRELSKDVKDNEKVIQCDDKDQECKDSWKRMKQSGKALDSVALDGDDGQRWIDLHDDIMRRSSVDKTVSRFAMLWALYQATPFWIKIIMFIMMVVFALVAFIPGLMILLELLSNKIAMFKLGFLCAFVFMVFLGFALLPI
jgi:hypothetical protein